MTTKDDDKELDELLREYRLTCFLVRDNLYIRHDDSTDLLARQNIVTKQKLKDYIIKRYLPKSRVLEAIPPELEQPKQYLQEHTELQRATTQARIEGFNQAIKQAKERLGLE